MRDRRQRWGVMAVVAAAAVLVTVSGCSSNGAGNGGGNGGGSSDPETYQIGDIGPAGGVVFYDKGAYSDGWRYLEAAPASTEWSDKPWGGYNTEVGAGANGTAIGTGAANTQAIVTEYGEDEPYADRSDYPAKLSDDLEHGGYSDWFLPSRYELNEMYTQREAIGGFASTAAYWSSTESGALNAWARSFDNENQGYWSKGQTYRVRAVRVF